MCLCWTENDQFDDVSLVEESKMLGTSDSLQYFT